MATRAEVAAARSAAYVQQSSRLREATKAAIVAYFLAGQFRDADMGRFLARAVPVVLSARQRMASLTVAYLSRALQDSGTAPVRAVSVPDVSALRGVDPLEVYSRPFRQVWTELSLGQDLQEAITAGQRRAEQLVATDLQLAKTHAAQAVMEQSSAEFYQRVLRGEHDCAKCVITSTRVYHKADLLPIHPGCNCDVQPINDLAAFKAEAKQRLMDAHDLVATTFGPDAANPSATGYSDLIVVHDHGEYGPTLAVRGQHFTGPAAI